jgi:hypothetical protein
VLTDFFPPLASGVLKTASARDARYAWSTKTRADTSGVVNDTLDVPMHQEGREDGTLTWDRRLGPLQWERTITVSGGIEAKGPIKRGIRSVVTQRIRVTRVAGYNCTAGGDGAPDRVSAAVPR